MTSTAHVELNVELGALNAEHVPPSYSEAHRGPSTMNNGRPVPNHGPYLRTNEPFKFAPPKPDGDPWEIALEPSLKADRAQCEAWKEEVQNLLIFSGLFSGVVTAFIIESYKTLQPDPQDTTVFFLSQILARLENGTSGSTLPSTNQAQFIPPASAERINVFWIISLMLSLATALIGITSLQWLHAYQSYSNSSSQEAFSLFNMRREGLKKWHVPKVFTALPLLLLSALVLFLAGMIDFSLSQLGSKVAIETI